MNGATLDTPLRIAGWTLAALGVAVFALAMFRDRARGRRRCPKCWYDMKGTPGPTCPECGKTAAGKRSLLRTRRHWRRGLGGVLLTIVGAGGIVGPRAVRDGWMAVIPTDILVHFAPNDSEHRAAVQRRLGRGTPAVHPVSAELWRRLQRWDFSARQWRIILEQSGAIQTRPEWPADRPLAVEFLAPAAFRPHLALIATPRLPHGHTIETAARTMWSEGAYSYGSLSIAEVGMLAPDTRSVTFDVEIRYFEPPNTSWLGERHPEASAALYPPTARTRTVTIQVPVRAREGVSDILTSVDSQELRDAVREGLYLKVRRRVENEYVVEATIPTRLGSNLTLEIWAERDGVRMGPPVSVPPDAGLTHLPVFGSALTDREAQDPALSQRWSIHVGGTPTGALVSWTAKEYWNGELVMPLSELMHRDEDDQ